MHYVGGELSFDKFRVNTVFTGMFHLMELKKSADLKQSNIDINSSLSKISLRSPLELNNNNFITINNSLNNVCNPGLVG